MQRLLTALAALAALLALPLAARAQLKIVTTAPDYADIARQIGGEHVEVHSVMKGPENVHNVMAKPTQMLMLNRADLFVHSGLDSEPWRGNLLRGARNPRVLPDKPGNIDMSRGIELLEVPAGKIDRSMGDVHAYGNPHYQLDPPTVQRMAATLAHALARADPEHADAFRENARRFVTDIDQLHKSLKEKFAPYAGLKVVTYHAGWAYFAKAFDLEVVATIEPKPSITPSPAEVRRVIDTMKRQGVKVVIVETYSSHEQARAIAQAAGATVVVLPDHVNGVPEADTYQRLFTHNIDKLIAAAQAAGVPPRDGGRPPNPPREGEP